MSTPITFIIPGRPAGSALRGAAAGLQPLPGGLRSGRVKAAVQVGVSRDAGAVRVDAVPGEDIVVMSIDGGPELTLHPETARDLLMAQAGRDADRGATPIGPAGVNEVSVPSALRWNAADPAMPAVRSAIGDLVGGVVLKAMHVITGAGTDAIAGIAAGQLAARVDAQVVEGVYKLVPEVLRPLKGSPAVERIDPTADNAPLLVFVHGTFSNTADAFQQLWRENGSEVATIFERYHDAVYALDHATLGASPMANAIILARALPEGARLHLVTHSRGGLVAEVLARMCAQPTLSDAEIAEFIAPQRDEMTTLAGLIASKRIQVDRVVRVACPARGTLLASRRIDAYLSVFKWGLQLAGLPVLPELIDFLAAVAQRREHADELPGLEAQIPNSPLIRWLHASVAPIPGELRVVAGDVEGDSVTSWVKTLLSDGFYWTDNDFVVQTRSMYGGARRAAGADSFLLDHGGKVSHSAYFGRERAARNVIDAILRQDPADFRVVGPLSWKGESSTGVRAALVSTDAVADSQRPAVFLIPGLCGSRLKDGDERLWPAALSFAAVDKLKYDATRAPFDADGLVGGLFDDLGATLAASHHVIPFPYDWRQPLEREAIRLAGLINQELDARSGSNQPIRILAYSSGCLLARAVQLAAPHTWQRMLTRPGSRLVMLGPPNAGFWTPMQMLTGDETFGGILTAGAPPFADAQLRRALGTMPGVLQLQAGLLDPQYTLGTVDTWQRLAERDVVAAQAMSSWHADPLQQETYRWGVPTTDALDAATALRRRLDDQAVQVMPGIARQIAMVVSTTKPTPVGFDTRAGFVYQELPGAGDGLVTTISARLPGVATWTVDCEHARLPAHRDAFRAYRDLLMTGTTAELPSADLTRGAPRDTAAARPTATRPSRQRVSAHVPEREVDVAITGSGRKPRPMTTTGRALPVVMVNGDLSFIRRPLVLGHYRSTKLTGTELVIDALIGDAMSESLAIGSYPEQPGTNRIFVNTHVLGDDRSRAPRPEAVIVVGLGDEGKLNSRALLMTVRDGVIAASQRVKEKDGAPALFDLAATLLGSGGKGMAVGPCAQLIAEGVRDANDRLSEIDWPRVRELQLVELYLDRATEAWRALRLQAQTSPGQFVVADTIMTGNGALRRPLDSNYRGAEYNFISATTQMDADSRSLIAYSLDTKRARTEVTAQTTQAPLLRELVGASNSLITGSDIGRTLFNLLVPAEIEPFLGGSTEMVIDLNQGTAGVPWELLDTNTDTHYEEEPWAIRAKLIRKLRTADFRRQTADTGADDRVLVIGEPQCDRTESLRLAGARAEANAVADLLGLESAMEAEAVTRLVSDDDEDLPGPDALAVLTALHRHRWRIIHIAGHGEMTVGTKLGGVVLSPSGPDHTETFLSALEVASMRVVPELVFVNCCHIAARERLQLLAADGPAPRHYDRPRFAAGMAEELINIGVRCVIAAGWAVEDNAAKTFATTFYQSLLGGQRFIDAVAHARRAARRHGGNTWAAYQCYGNPEWTFLQRPSDAQAPAADDKWEKLFAGVSSPRALTLALDTLAVRAKFQKKPGADTREHAADLRAGIVYLEQRFGARWRHIGEVAEAFGSARAEIGDRKQAVEWYGAALAANDGSASLRSAEQFGNLSARLAWNTVSALVDATPAPSGAEPTLLAAAAEIERAIEHLKAVAAIQETMERCSLIGSAYKRLAMVWGAAGKEAEEHQAIEAMRTHYVHAESIGRTAQATDTFYPAINRLVADVAKGERLSAASMATVESWLAEKAESDPDFWSLVGAIELRIYRALGKGQLASTVAGFGAEFDALKQRVPAASMWSTVYDNARFVLGLYSRRARQRAALATVDPAKAARARGEADAADTLLTQLRALAR